MRVLSESREDRRNPFRNPEHDAYVRRRARSIFRRKIQRQTAAVLASVVILGHSLHGFLIASSGLQKIAQALKNQNQAPQQASATSQYPPNLVYASDDVASLAIGSRLKTEMAILSNAAMSGAGIVDLDIATETISDQHYKPNTRIINILSEISDKKRPETVSLNQDPVIIFAKLEAQNQH